MSLTLIGIIGILILLLLLFVFSMPVSFAMALVGFCGFSYIINFNAGVNMVSSELWSVYSKYGLTVIPLFIFMGTMLERSGVAADLLHCLQVLLRRTPGGLALAGALPGEGP